MANLRMVIDNYVDNSVLTATPAFKPNLPVSNLKTPARAKICRSTDTSSQEISGIFSELKTVSSVILGRHNIAIGAKVTIELFSDVSLSSSLYNTTITINSSNAGTDLWPWGDFIYGSVAWGADKQVEAFSPKANLVHWITTPIVNVQGFKITVLPTGSTGKGLSLLNKGFTFWDADTDTFEFGRLIIGEYIEPTYNTSYGHNMSWEESTKQFRTDAGTLRSDISLPNRRIEFDIGTMTEADRTNIQAALRTVGLRKDFYISLFPEDSDVDKQIDYSGIVKLVKVPKYTEYANNYYKSKYVLEEV